MKFTRLTTCGNLIEANIIKGKLESEGVYCFLTNEHFSSLMPHFSGMLGAGVQVMVNRDALPRAQELLRLHTTQTPVCPECQSSRIKMSLGKHKFRKIVVILFSLLLAIPFNNVNLVRYCADCKKEF